MSIKQSKNGVYIVRNRSPCTLCNSSDNLTSWTYQGKTFQRCQTESCPNHKVKCLDNNNAVSAVSTALDVGSCGVAPEGYFSNQDSYLDIEGEYKEFRGISKETCELYNYKVSELNGEEVTIAQCLDQAGNFSSKKVRLPNKIFPWIEHKKGDQLFGLNLFNDYAQPLVITEGYEDAMSCYEAGYQAVSINHGAGNAVQDIQDNIEKLKKFKKIILFLDNDREGQKATKKILELFEYGEVYVVTKYYGAKDANEILQADIDIKAVVETAEEHKPEGLIYGDEITLESLLTPEPKGYPLPFPRLNEMIKGAKPGRLILVCAGSGSGKTTTMKHIVYPWLKDKLDIKVSHHFLEETQKYTANSYIGMHYDTPVFEFEEDPLGQLGKDKIEKARHDLLHNKKVMFDTHFGSLDSRDFIKKLRYLAKVKKFNVIILDHISIIVSGHSSEEGERRDIDILMTRLKELTVETGVSIIAVSHLKRPPGDIGYEEGKEVTLNSLRGSHSLAQLSDVVISIERNAQIDGETTLRVLKNRITGRLGVADKLGYLHNKGKLFVK